MEQRPLRLGDILDDYCTRERRVTNHAIVALVEQDVKQTRCTTCDAEHVYKGGKAPRRKKPETPGALYKEVLAGITDQDAPPAAGLNAVEAEAEAETGVEFEVAGEPPSAPAPISAADAGSHGSDDDADDEPQPTFDDGPVHRPLIRAQLARPEGIKIERQAPEFTIRQNPTGRGGSFRGGSNGGNGGNGGDMRSRGGGGGAGRSNGGPAGSNNGHRFGRGPRPAGGGGGRGPSQGFGRGPGGPGGPGGGQQRPGGPRKRSR